MREKRDDHDDTPPANHALAGLRALRAGLPDGPAPEADATDAEPPAKPEDDLPRLVARKERKGHGGRTATRVSGLLADTARRDETTRALKRALGCGARWDEGDLVVQGGDVERVAAWFEARGHVVVRGTR